jgi:hypothetical protein
MELSQLGRLLLVIGLVVAGLGLLFTFAERVPFLGRLPGDIRVGGEGWTVYAPIATMILLSLLLTAVLNVVAWFGRR